MNIDFVKSLDSAAVKGSKFSISWCFKRHFIIDTKLRGIESDYELAYQNDLILYEIVSKLVIKIFLTDRGTEVECGLVRLVTPAPVLRIIGVVKFQPAQALTGNRF